MNFPWFEIQKYIIISTFSFEMYEDIGESSEMLQIWPLTWNSPLYIQLRLAFFHLKIPTFKK